MDVFRYIIRILELLEFAFATLEIVVRSAYNVIQSLKNFSNIKNMSWFS